MSTNVIYYALTLLRTSDLYANRGVTETAIYSLLGEPLTKEDICAVQFQRKEWYSAALTRSLNRAKPGAHTTREVVDILCEMIDATEQTTREYPLESDLYEEAGAIEQLRNDPANWDHVFRSTAISEDDKIKFWTEWVRQYDRSYSTALVYGLLPRPASYTETERVITKLVELERDHDEIDWVHLTLVAHGEYIRDNPQLPWLPEMYLVRNDLLWMMLHFPSCRCDKFMAAYCGYTSLDHITDADLSSIGGPFQHSHLHDKKIKGVWRVALHGKLSWAVLGFLKKHGYAGVIQRCWRRHRERLRRRTFVRFCDCATLPIIKRPFEEVTPHSGSSTYLGLLPADILLMLYRLWRGCPRGLPSMYT